MRHIEAKAERQEKVMREAGRWLDEPPFRLRYQMPFDAYPPRLSVWRRRANKLTALRRVWREKYGSGCF